MKTAYVLAAFLTLTSVAAQVPPREGVLAQQAVPYVSLQQFVRSLGVILAEPAGIPGVVVVVGVLDGAAGAAAGFQPGDKVLRVGEHAINKIADVLDALGLVAPGAGIDMVVQRGDQEQTLHVSPGPISPSVRLQ